MDLGGGNQNDHFVFTVNTFDANGRSVFRHVRNTGGDNFERDGRIDFKLDIFFNLIAAVCHDDLENRIVTAIRLLLEHDRRRRIELPYMIQHRNQRGHYDSQRGDNDVFQYVHNGFQTKIKSANPKEAYTGALSGESENRH